jgi:hypothetical protein
LGIEKKKETEIHNEAALWTILVTLWTILVTLWTILVKLRREAQIKWTFQKIPLDL